MSSSESQIVVAAPIMMKHGIWNRTPDQALRYTPGWFRDAARLRFEPEVPTTDDAADAATVLYLLWSGCRCHLYTQNVSGWLVGCTCGFFDKKTGSLIGTIEFVGGSPPVQTMVFSGTGAYQTGQVLGALPAPLFSVQKLPDGRYSISPQGQARGPSKKRWRLRTCEKCGDVTPHGISGLAQFLRPIFPRLGSEHCLACANKPDYSYGR